MYILESIVEYEGASYVGLFSKLEYALRAIRNIDEDYKCHLQCFYIRPAHLDSYNRRGYESYKDSIKVDCLGNILK